MGPFSVFCIATAFADFSGVLRVRVIFDRGKGNPRLDLKNRCANLPCSVTVAALFSRGHLARQLSPVPLLCHVLGRICATDQRPPVSRREHGFSVFLAASPMSDRCYRGQYGRIAKENPDTLQGGPLARQMSARTKNAITPKPPCEIPGLLRHAGCHTDRDIVER